MNLMKEQQDWNLQVQREEREWRERETQGDREWKSKETRFRQLELLGVIVLAPLMAWFIPWIANKLAPSAPAPMPTATAAPIAK